MAVSAIAPAETKGKGNPTDQEARLQPAASAHPQHGHGHDELYSRHESEEPTAQGDGFDSFRLEYAPEELTSPLLVDLLRRQPGLDLPFAP